VTGSTRISGNGDWQPCLNKAAMLILDIYGYPDSDLTPRLRQEKARLWDHWQRGWSMDLPNGMFCRLYHPKRSGRQTPLDVCPPALVFRGSEMNAADIDEIAVHAEVRCMVTPTGVMSWAMDASTLNPIIPTISPTGRFPPTASRASLRAAGLREQPLVLQSTGRETISVNLGPVGIGSMHIDWTGSASLFYGPNGDWPTNISQALGNVPPQYLDAMRAARRAADEAMASWNGRLMILGHSLGGGLASCAALAAKAHKPELQVKCDTYNASGLHAATARRAGSRLSDASRAGIKARQVAGDVLTSLQTPGLIPLVSDVLRWGGVTLPPPIPASMPNHGTSPGGRPSMMFTKWERAPEWRALPVLFPLRNQNLVATDFAQLNRIFAAARTPDFRTFVSNLIAALFTALGDQNGRLRTWHLADFYSAHTLAIAQAQIAAAGFVRETSTPPPISTAPYFSLGTSDYLRNQVEPFFNGLFRDAIGFTHIMKAAVDYHMWDACAYTFLLEPER
jgi:hypothetical protein